MFARIIKFIGIVLLLLWGWIAVPACAEERPVTVALVIDADSHIHDKAVEGINQTIDDSGQQGINFRTIDINSAESVRAIMAPDINYAIVVGVKPALFVLGHNPSYPVLYTLVPENTYKEITEKRIPAVKQSPEDDYVIYLGQPTARQLALSQIITGKKSKVGLVVGEYSRHEADGLIKAAKNSDIDLYIKESPSEEAAIEDMRRALMDSDIYLALYDTTILNRHNAKWLLYMAYKMNKPVIGFSSSYTRAGAVASIFSTPEQIGRQSAEWLIAMLNKRALPMRQYPEYFSITTNPSIQRILHFDIRSGEEIKDIMQTNAGVKAQ